MAAGEAVFSGPDVDEECDAEEHPAIKTIRAATDISV